MDRRGFLGLLAAGVAASLAACDETVAGHHASAPAGLAPRTPRASAAPVRATAAEGMPQPPPSAVSSSAGLDSQPRTIDVLPQSARGQLALTVDDGVSTEVLDAYLDFMIQTGVRITFFVNGVRPSWTVLRDKLAPLVESGQAQLGNHTWDHPAITRLSHEQLVEQLTRNENFLRDTYGVDPRPYFRPPFGLHSQWTDYLTNELGYSRTVMWFGTLGDAAVITPKQIIANARQWFVPGRIVIGHANHPAVTHTFKQLIETIRERHLDTVTLRDAFAL